MGAMVIGAGLAPGTVVGKCDQSVPSSENVSVVVSLPVRCTVNVKSVPDPPLNTKVLGVMVTGDAPLLVVAETMTVILVPGATIAGATGPTLTVVVLPWSTKVESAVA